MMWAQCSITTIHYCSVMTFSTVGIKRVEIEQKLDLKYSLCMTFSSQC